MKTKEEKEKELLARFKALEKEMDKLLRVSWYHRIFDWFSRRFK